MTAPIKLVELTKDEYWAGCRRLGELAKALAKEAQDNDGSWPSHDPAAYWGTSYKPCNALDLPSERSSWSDCWYQISKYVAKLKHFAHTDCGHFEASTMVTCYATIHQGSKWRWFRCYHLVGQCPWKHSVNAPVGEAILRGEPLP